MIIVRHTFKTTRGGWRQAAEILKKAHDNGQMALKAARISTAGFGTMDQVAVEYEVESLDELEDLGKEQPWWREINQYLTHGNTLKTWYLLE